MSLIKNHTWKGLAVAAAMLLSVGLMQVQTAFAATTVTRANASISTTLTAATGGSAPAFTTLGSVVLTLSAANDIVAGPLTLTAPTGWSWNTAATAAVAVSSTGAIVTTAAPTATVHTITVTGAGANTAAGTITISNLQIQPNTLSTATGNIVSNANGTLAASTNLGTMTALTDAPIGGIATLVLTTSACSVAVDGSTTATISAKATDGVGNTITNLLVSLTASRGTLSATSSTTSSSALTTGATGTGTITFRGNGTTGDANITGTTAAPNPSIATVITGCTDGVIKVVSTSSTVTEMKLLDTTFSGHIAANSSTVYSSPQTYSRVRFQVRGGTGFGVNGKLIQATVDKGYVQSGDNTACAASNTTASIASATVTIDTTQVDGVAVFTVCARAGQVGATKITVKDLSDTIPDASATLTSAGTPNKIETTVTGGAVTATVKDKDGNEVADGTTVTFGVPSFTGTVAPTCGLTTNGKVSAAAAFSGTGGQVLITVFINDSGTANTASTCTSLGSVSAASTVVNVGAGVPSTPGAALILGTVPGAGRFGLIGVATATTVDALIAAATTAGCNVTSLSITSAAAASGWLVHIKGAPAAVNTSFPGTAAVAAGGAGLLCG